MNEKRWLKYYSMLPLWAQNTACSLAGLKIRYNRYNSEFYNALEFLRSSQWSSYSEQKSYQDEQLQHLVQYAYDTVPFYREIFDAQKLFPKDIHKVEDLKKLPILEKKTVRKRFKDLQSRSWPKRLTRYAHTGGTTGTALQLAWDVNTQPWQCAVWWRHRERFGIDIHDPFIAFGSQNVVPLKTMRPPIWRSNLPMRQTYVSVQHMIKENMPILADYLCSRKVKYYSGFPSAIYLLACYFIENGIHLPNPPRVIFTGSETLLAHQRRVISIALDTVVADFYGASEYCVNISECEKNVYHVDTESGVVEFIPMKGMPDNVRRIVCTGFHNKAMPLIRYDIGDIVTLSEKACLCGRQSPTVEKIDGRIESYILTPDGRQLGRLSRIFKESSKIEEAQFIQEKISSVTVRVVPSSGYSSKDEKSLISDLRRYLGKQIEIELEYIDAIPRETNGKFRQIISHVFKDKYKTINFN